MSINYHLTRFAYCSELQSTDASTVFRVLNSANLVLLFEGGTFMWPGVKIGHMRSVSISLTKRLTLRTLALQPLLFQVEEQVSESQLVAKNEPRNCVAYPLANSLLLAPRYARVALPSRVAVRV